MAGQFQHLTQPGRIGSLLLKNRMTVAAMGVNLGEADGSCGDRILAYHERQAAGGAGLIVMGATGVAWPEGSVQPHQVAISDDSHIPGLKAVAEACHHHGAKIAAQIHHGGLVAVANPMGRPILMPSKPPAGQSDLGNYLLPEEIASLWDPEAPKPEFKVMDLEDIEAVKRRFGQAAIRAREAGLDGVEIHGGHGYILSEFLSPAMNQRDDEYGGCLENRARLLLEVIAEVRRSVGNDFPVWVKLDSQEFCREEGITLEDARATARMVEAAGVDAIAVSGYHNPNEGATHAQSNIPHPEEHMVANATAIKRSVSIPVIAAGRIEPKSANRHIGKGNFDFLSMGRKILADPDLPKKLAAGTLADIRPCIYCYCCASQIYVKNAVKCAVNPETARERDRTLLATDARKHVAVIGGGPGGMEAARRLSLRGHRVTLLEASGRLGGTLQFASIPYEPNQRLLQWLRDQVNASPVNVQLNTPATEAYLQQLGVDEVVVAVGAKREMPDLPGGDRDFVFSGDEMRSLMAGDMGGDLKRKVDPLSRALVASAAKTGLTALPGLVRTASHAWLPLGKNITIIGGELVGLELAEFLAERGRRVTVLEETNHPGKGLFLVRRMRLLSELPHLGVDLRRGATEIAIGEHRVSYTNGRGQQRSVAADHVIVATGATGDDTLSVQLEQAGFTVHSIGDCTGVGYIEGAMESAADVAMTIG
ncbi:MAG: FAD-dependent oxidoreductase [Halioglobus sp.]